MENKTLRFNNIGKIAFGMSALLVAFLLVGAAFGYGFSRWYEYRVQYDDLQRALGLAPVEAAEAAAAPAVPPADGAQKAAQNPAQNSDRSAAPPDKGSNEDHLIRMQTSVLEAIALSNTRARETLDFAILTVGFVGSLILAVFAYFGLSTARDARQVKTEAEQLLAELKKLQVKFDKSEQEFNARALQSLKRIDKTQKHIDETQNRISADILATVTPKLEQITNYGMKIGEFAGTAFNSMSTEDRLRDCQEAADALEAAGLGNGADRARSFILARQGVALLLSGAALDAVGILEKASATNVARKPDRPFNLACAYARLAKLPGSEAVYAAKAIAQLKTCLELGTDEGEKSTISKAYFLAKIRSDSDLNAIRENPEFKKLLPPLGPEAAV